MSLSPEQRDAFRTQLDAEIAATEAKLIQLKESAAPVAPDSALGRLTRMESLNDQGVGKMALNQAQERLYGLQQALKKLDDPTFGLCRRCRQPIPLERLVALPESTLCVRCATAR